MKIKLFNQINESSYHDFLTHYDEEIEKSIKLLIKLQDANIDDDKIDDKLSVYDTNVKSKIDEWIYDTPSRDEIAEFAIRNQDRWGTEPQMVLYAIEDYATECKIYDDNEDDDDDNDKGDFYEGSFQFNDENENKIDNYTSRYYDRYDNEESNQIELFENFSDNITFEMSGSPLPYFKTKADFVEAMLNCGYHHSTLNKKTNMLICSTEDLGTLKFKKAQKYGIPIYTYAQAKKEMKNLINTISKYNL